MGLGELKGPTMMESRVNTESGVTPESFLGLDSVRSQPHTSMGSNLDILAELCVQQYMVSVADSMDSLKRSFAQKSMLLLVFKRNPWTAWPEEADFGRDSNHRSHRTREFPRPAARD